MREGGGSCGGVEEGFGLCYDAANSVANAGKQQMEGVVAGITCSLVLNVLILELFSWIAGTLLSHMDVLDNHLHVAKIASDRR